MKKNPEIYLPCLRGVFGDWIYYSSLMSVAELAFRVNFAKEIHNSDGLEKMIQRELKENRAQEILDYLKDNEDRFFNSLVVAVYDGEPRWHPSDFRDISPEINRDSISEDALHSIGFLRLGGQEKLFALDGQHRLAGIKKYIKDPEAVLDDEVSVIFVAHKNDPLGLQRTRKLFTTLNKQAKKVTKGEIIALDENDVSAIIVRKLLEDGVLFNDNRISFKTTNVNPSDRTSLTTIGNLYDNVQRLLSSFPSTITGLEHANLRYHSRKDDKDISAAYRFVVDFFKRLGTVFPPVGEYFSTNNEQEVIDRHRTAQGGHILFRPIGLNILFEIILFCGKANKTVDETLCLCAKIPVELTDDPYNMVIWNPVTQKVALTGRATVRDILLSRLGLSLSKSRLQKAEQRYNKLLGKDNAF